MRVEGSSVACRRIVPRKRVVVDVYIEGAAALESFARLDGVPMRVRTYDAGQFNTETLVKQLTNKVLPRPTFGLPEGYSPQLTINIR